MCCRGAAATTVRVATSNPDVRRDDQDGGSVTTLPSSAITARARRWLPSTLRWIPSSRRMSTNWPLSLGTDCAYVPAAPGTLNIVHASTYATRGCLAASSFMMSSSRPIEFEYAASRIGGIPIQIRRRPPAVSVFMTEATRRRYSLDHCGSGGLCEVPSTSIPWSSLAPTMKTLTCGSRARTTASMCFGQSQNSLRTSPVPTWYSASGLTTPVLLAATKTAQDGPAASESPPTHRRSGVAAVGVASALLVVRRVVVVVVRAAPVVVVGRGVVVTVVVVGAPDVAVTLGDDVVATPSSRLLLHDTVGSAESTTAMSPAKTATSAIARTRPTAGRRAGGCAGSDPFIVTPSAAPLVPARRDVRFQRS